METSEQLLASLSPEQRRLVEHWLRQGQAEAIAAPQSHSIPHRRTTDAAPLSFAQQRLWLLNQLEPGSPAYHFRTAIRLIGRLDIAVLARSLNAIVERHEALRTTVHSTDGLPRQVIAARMHLALPLLDLGCLPPDLRAAQIPRLALLAIKQPFDLEQGPLLRAQLLRLATEEHVLLLVLHHIITDDWSQGILLRELTALYAAFLAGTPPQLPTLPVQYADYAVWQREWLQGSGVRGQGSGVRGQGVTALLPPPAGGGTEGGRNQVLEVG